MPDLVAIEPPYPPRTYIECSLDLLFPPICVGCRRIGRWICTSCWGNVRWLGERRCDRCGRRSPTPVCIHCLSGASALDGVVAVAEFEGSAREAVHALKYHERHAIAAMMGRLMAHAAQNVQADYVVPVPLHRKRRRERGYDQSVFLAKEISRSLHVPSRMTALTRVRETKQQALLKAEDRPANVDGAFQCLMDLDGASVLLIDDVSTTGATFESAAGALKANGAGTITGLVFAHPRPDTDRAADRVRVQQPSHAFRIWF